METSHPASIRELLFIGFYICLRASGYTVSSKVKQSQTSYRTLQIWWFCLLNVFAL